MEKSERKIKALESQLSSVNARFNVLHENYLSLLESSSKIYEHLLLLDLIETHIFYLTDPATYGIVNRAHADFFGVTKSDLENKSLYEILSKQEADRCTEGNRAIFLEKEVIHTEEILKRADGQERFFVFTKTPMLDNEGNVKYVICTGEDVTEKETARHELKKHQYFLENIIESIQDGVSVLDKDLTILHTNSVMRNWYKNSGKLIGQKCYKAYHNSDTQCRDCPTTKALKSGVTESNIVPGPSGTSIDWLEIYSYPVKDSSSGKVSGVVEFVRNISDRIKLEAQLSQAQKMEAVGTLSAGIAHDFNNILQAIMGSIQLLLINKDDNHQDFKYLSLIEKSTTRAQELTSRMLLLGKKIDSNPQTANLNDELNNLVEILERSLPKMVSIHQKHGKNLKDISVDLSQLEQILLNLAINASHAMPDGGKLLIETENFHIDEIHLKTNKDFQLGEYVLLTIGDTGHGMDAEVINHIFEPFFTTKDTGKGTGLGLSMVYGIVKNHGGVITCYSEPGIGTTFRLFFPACRKHLPSTYESKKETLNKTSGETILVVDDETILLDIACLILEQNGYITARAESGEEALSILGKEENKIDLVLLDLNMPGMGGYKCLDKINMIEDAPKVIIATGYAPGGDPKEAIEAGASALLGKPYKIDTMINTIQKVLSDNQPK